MSNRTKICKITIGSNLYGTNRPESDMDISGVFLPSEDDLLGLQNPPEEMSESVKKSSGPRNELGDLDCKFYSLRRFFNLAAQGQPGQLELLFAPRSAYHALTEVQSHKILTPIHPDWMEVLNNRELFLSRSGVGPFVGFALSQAYKTYLKGDNLNQLRDVIMWGGSLTPHEQQEPLRNYMIPASDHGPDGTSDDIPNQYRFFCSRSKAMTGYDFELRENDHHFSCLWIAGRQYDPGAKTKTILKNLEGLEKRYGTRSNAAAAFGLDFKSLMHAYRLLSEAEEFMETGHITLPRPPEEVKRLLDIRAGNMPDDFDWHADILSRIDRIRTDLEPNSPLPKLPNWSKIGELHREIMRKHLKG